MKKLRIISILMMLLLLMSVFAGCSNKATETEANNEHKNEEAVVENNDKGDENTEAVVENKKGILVVSFGTSYADTRKASIEACENVIANAYPEYEVRRAFTSQIIIDKLEKRDNIIVENPVEALNKMKEEGFTEVVVQPLHIIPGAEYNDLLEVVTSFNDGSFEKLALGRPILTHIEDYEAAAEALKSQLPEIGEGQAVVLMGHGTEHPANSSYACFQSVVIKAGLDKVYVGTVEGYPALDDVLVKLNEDNISEVTLMPFMVVAGDHANNDMAGDEEDSWKTVMKKEGLTVNTYIHGVGENSDFQSIYVAHVKDALEGNGQEIPEPVKAAEDNSANWEEAKKAILVVSFGTSYADTREASIEATEKVIDKAYPEYEVKRAFTSQIIIDKLAKRDNIIIENPEQAFEKMIEEGYEEVIVQPLHIMQGEEYHELKEVFEKYESAFKTAELGRPLLYTIEDYEVAVEALKSQLPETSEGQAIVLMGHGTEHPANSTYACFDDMLKKAGLNKVYVGTVEGYPALDDVLSQLKENNITEVTLMPFMIVAGDHANNDMAGDEEDSWKTVMKKEGLTVNTYIHGIGENEDFQNIYVEHIKNAIEGEEE